MVKILHHRRQHCKDCLATECYIFDIDGCGPATLPEHSLPYQQNVYQKQCTQLEMNGFVDINFI